MMEFVEGTEGVTESEPVASQDSKKGAHRIAGLYCFARTAIPHTTKARLALAPWPTEAILWAFF